MPTDGEQHRRLDSKCIVWIYELNSSMEDESIYNNAATHCSRPFDPLDDWVNAQFFWRQRLCAISYLDSTSRRRRRWWRSRCLRLCNTYHYDFDSLQTIKIRIFPLGKLYAKPWRLQRWLRSFEMWGTFREYAMCVANYVYVCVWVCAVWANGWSCLLFSTTFMYWSMNETNR